MSKEMTVVALGIWIIIIPYLGVPNTWRTMLLIISGLCIVLVGLMLRTKDLSRGGGHHHPFVENTAHTEDQSSHERKERITSLN